MHHQQLYNSELHKHSVVKRSTTTSSPYNVRGRDSRNGILGPGRIVGHPGPKRDKGIPGPKGDGTGRVVYVCWGHNSCQDGEAQLVYVGRAGGSHFTHKGGGGNPQCLLLDLNSIKQSVEHRIKAICTEQNIKGKF